MFHRIKFSLYYSLKVFVVEGEKTPAERRRPIIFAPQKVVMENKSMKFTQIVFNVKVTIRALSGKDFENHKFAGFGDKKELLNISMDFVFCLVGPIED